MVTQQLCSLYSISHMDRVATTTDAFLSDFRNDLYFHDHGRAGLSRSAYHVRIQSIDQSIKLLRITPWTEDQMKIYSVSFVSLAD